VGKVQVDGVVVNQDDCSIIPAHIRETNLQTNVDEIIAQKCKPACRFRSDYTTTTTQNAMRQLHSEEQVAKFLRKSKYDLVVVAGPDYYFANKINIDHVNDSLTCHNCVYTSQVNDAEGYTNGFYFGRPDKVIAILERFDDFVNSNHDYEYTIKKSFVKHGIERKATDIVFWKIRANGKAHWQGGARTDWLSDEKARRIRNLYESQSYPN
jgi:hypothetical protein